jgi:hypothetical protein
LSHKYGEIGLRQGTKHSKAGALRAFVTQYQNDSRHIYSTHLQFRTLAQRQRILEITRRRQAAGLASDIDVSSIETTLPAGRRDHEQIGAQIALLRNQLAALIGKGPGDGEATRWPKRPGAPA